MTIYHRLTVMLGLIWYLAFNGAPALARQPNILVIMADDLGFADVSYYTGANASIDLSTPNIDSLADAGLRFDNFYANSTVCSPTRAAFLTGKFPGLVGVPGVLRTQPQNSWGFFSPTVPTLPGLLQTGGYYTGLVGKWHLGLESPNLPNQRGFDYFHGFLGDMMDDYCTHLRDGSNYMRENDRVLPPDEHKGHATTLFTNWAIDFIRRRSAIDQPFFLFLSYNAPHTPIYPPPCPHEPPAVVDDKAMRSELVKLIEDLDGNIGRVIAALEDYGVKDNTLVIFTSDNGGQKNDAKWVDLYKYSRANNGPYKKGKEWLYEGGLRVPAVAVWPGKIRPGTPTGAVALTMDLFPTLLAAAGIDPPAEIDGTSLMPVLDNSGSLAADRLLFWERREGYTTNGSYYAGRSGDWKLLQPRWPADAFELYNLSADPYEGSEKCAAKPAECSELRALVDDYIARSTLVPFRDSRPFNGVPFGVNETIEAEDFDIYFTARPANVGESGEGAAYHDYEPENLLGGVYRQGEGVDIKESAAASNNHNIGSARAGEWLAYTVDIPASGDYRLVARVALPGEGGTFHVEFLNEDKTGAMVIPDTGGWQKWTEIESQAFRLDAGTQKMRVILDADVDGMDYVGNFDSFKIVPADNIAEHKPAFASSVEDDDPDLAPDKAVDGDLATRWSSKYFDPQWITVDLGSRYDISRVVLVWEVAFGRGYEIQVSDDMRQWTTVYHESNSNGGTDDLAITATGRYVRMYGIKRGTRWGYSLWAFEIYGMPSSDGGLASSMTFGEVQVDHTWRRVDFDQAFDSPVVVAGPLSLNGEDPAVVRIRNVNQSGFDIRLQEWDYLDVRHVTETVGYLVMEEGTHTLDDGTLVQATTIDTSAARAFAPVGFDTAFNAVPVVMSTITSFNDETPVTGRIRSVTTVGFQFRMQEEEENIQDHGAERLSFIAWEPSSGSLGDVAYQVQRTPNTVTHASYAILFDPAFAWAPVFLADMQTTDGSDTADVRCENKDELGADVLIDEETSLDDETNHTTEVVGFMAFGQ